MAAILGLLRSRPAALSLLLLTSGCLAETTADQARQLVTAGARLVDVTDRAEFAQGHAEGAINLPITELDRRIAELEPKDRPVIVYCHTGVRSRVAYWKLRRAGFSAVYDLGTLARWRNRVRPMTDTLF